MGEIIQFALLGLGAGAAYALLGQGVVLVYRGSGVLNLAQGAFAMAGAFGYYELHTVHGYSVGVSMAGAMLALALIGAAFDQACLRRLRSGSALASLVATLGVLLILQSIGIERYGTGSVFGDPLFEQQSVELLGTTVGSDRLWLAGLAVATTAALSVIWRLTPVGWVMAAVAENRRSAAALGWSAERVSAGTWALGAGLSAFAGIVSASVTQLSVTNLTLLVIPALAAALVGGFSSYGLTLVGGLGLGVAQSLTLRYADVTGASDAVPFLVIVVLLIIRGKGLPTRGQSAGRLPAVGSGRLRPIPVAMTGIAAALVVSLLLNVNGLNAAIVCFAAATILLSIVVLTGYAGQLSLAQFSLAGVGALIAARLVEAHGFGFVPALAAGTIGTAVLGVVFAIPALRTRGVELAVVTLGLAVALQELVFNNEWFTGSVAGTPVGAPSLFGFDLDPVAHPARYALFALLVLVVSALAVTNLRRGRSGRRMLAVRANERAAAALGINVFSSKLHAFAFGGALAGLGGIVLAFQASTVVYGGFGPLASISAVATAVIGGVGYVIGAVLGALLQSGSLLHSVLASGKYLPLISGIGVVLFVMIDPHGLAHALVRLLPRRLRQRATVGTGAPGDKPPEPQPDPVHQRGLAVEGLGVRYGGVVAVDAVSFTVKPGEIVGLIGPNGAGKTSIIDAISGFVPATGRVTLGEAAIDSWPAHRRARSGLVRSFQSLELFEDMTIRENLQAASDARDGRAMLTDLVRPGRAALPAAALAAIREFDLEAALDQRPDELSYGKRRLVAVARAVAMEPSILLLDEPVAGLDDVESAELARLIRRLVDRWRIGVLLIEHDMALVMGICDRLEVIDFGRPIASGTPEEISHNPAAVAAYLGDDALVADAVA